MPSKPMSDKAVAVFAFAAYHQLSSGETVIDVVLNDEAGHSADPEAVKELERNGLARIEGDRIVFTDTGKSTLEAMVEALRTAA